jgi:precorrin-3B methylase
MTGPPTREEMFDNAVALLDQAYQALGDAADWLRSDWTPVGSALTEEQAARRTRTFDEIDKAKQAINRAKD